MTKYIWLHLLAEVVYHSLTPRAWHLLYFALQFPLWITPEKADDILLSSSLSESLLRRLMTSCSPVPSLNHSWEGWWHLALQFPLWITPEKADDILLVYNNVILASPVLLKQELNITSDVVPTVKDMSLGKHLLDNIDDTFLSVCDRLEVLFTEVGNLF